MQDVYCLRMTSIGWKPDVARSLAQPSSIYRTKLNSCLWPAIRERLISVPLPPLPFPISSYPSPRFGSGWLFPHPWSWETHERCIILFHRFGPIAHFENLDINCRNIVNSEPKISRLFGSMDKRFQIKSGKNIKRIVLAWNRWRLKSHPRSIKPNSHQISHNTRWRLVNT